MSQKFIMAGVMGWPVTHSRSPLIHNYWIAQHSLNGAYGHFQVHPDNLETAIRGMTALGLAGCNITIPHKVNAMQYVDWVDSYAQKIGAINAIVIKEDGKLCGYNYDGIGYLQSIREHQPTWLAKDKIVVMLGAGGASRAILVALLEEGAQQIRLLNRTKAKADQIAQEFGSRVLALDWAERHCALAEAHLLINTTSQGMQGHPPLDIHLDNLPASALVSDIVYAPLETPLLAQAKQKGNPAINGLGMLVHQARPAFNAWFGVMPEVTPDLYKILIQTL